MQLIRVPCPVCGDNRVCYERTVRGFDLDRCLACGMIFVNPQYGPESLATLYHDRENSDELIQLYARLTTPGVLADIERIIVELEMILPGQGRILDVGCGAGYFLERAVKRGWDGHGIDFGSWVRKATAVRGLTNVYVGSIFDCKFMNGSFDVVSASQVLEHLPNPKRDLEEIRRIIRPGGLIYANVPNYQCLSILLRRDDFELNEPPQHVNYFTPKTLKNLLQKSGFEVLQTSSYGGLKWENLIGRPIHSDVAEAYRDKTFRLDQKSSMASTDIQSRLKRIIFPCVKHLLYRLAKVGMCVEVFARRR